MHVISTPQTLAYFLPQLFLSYPNPHPLTPLPPHSTLPLYSHFPQYYSILPHLLTLLLTAPSKHPNPFLLYPYTLLQPLPPLTPHPESLLPIPSSLPSNLLTLHSKCLTHIQSYTAIHHSIPPFLTFQPPYSSFPYSHPPSSHPLYNSTSPHLHLPTPI